MRHLSMYDRDFSFWVNFRSFWWDITRPIRRVCHFFGNVWFYRAILWSDYPQSGNGLLYIMKRKLEQMIPAEGEGRTWEEEKKSMRAALCLINRLIASDYIFHESYWDEGKSFMERMTDDRPYVMDFPKIPMHVHDEYMLAQDYRLLSKILCRHIQNWFD